MTDVPLTDAQFEALAKLVGLRSAQTQAAARLVLVSGVPAITAAATAGCSTATLGNMLTRLRAAIALARIVAGVA